MSNKRKLKVKYNNVFFIIILIIFIFFLSSAQVLLEKEIPKVEVEEPKVTETSLSLIMVGDCLIHGAIYDDAKTTNGSYDFSKMLELVKPIIQSYDLAFYNQESILGGVELGLSSYPRFNAPKEVGDAFLDLGFNLVSLANNHTLDKGKNGIYSSLNYWQGKENVMTAGTYSSEENRITPNIMEKNGITYALLAYTTTTNGLTPFKDEPYLITVYDEELVKADIERLRDKVDLLMVSMHWGEEYTHNPTEEQKIIAEYLASLNVDIIIGHHPHVVQPIDFIGNTMVIYSLGNFIASQYGINKLTGLMAGVTVKKTTIDDQTTITLEEPTAQLVYIDSKITNYRHDYKLYPYNLLTDDILENYKDHYNKYMGIVTSLNNRITPL